jgi:rubrerythrin
MNIEDEIPGEKLRAKAALEELPKNIQGFYVAHYILVDGSRVPYGTFIGLVCKCCGYWRDSGHEYDCPVCELENGGKPIPGCETLL